MPANLMAVDEGISKDRIICIMALSIECALGDKVYLNEAPLSLVSIEQDFFHVTFQGKIFMISEEEQTEIAPDVFLHSDRKTKFNAGKARLCFNAPRSVRILREKIKDGFNGGDT